MAGGFDEDDVSLFSARRLLAIAWATATSVVFANVAIKYFARQIFGGNYQLPVYWPVSIFVFRLGHLPLGWTLPMLAVAIGVVAATASYLRGEDTAAWPVLAGGFVLLVCSNLLYGFTQGFVVPLATREGYYQLASTVVNPLAFVRTYGANQLSYVVHAKTHPPGAVLTFTLLNRVLGSRPLVAAAIAVVSFLGSGWLVYRLVGTYYEPRVAQYTALLFLVLPAVQIYSLASIDAVIATLMLAAVYAFTRESWWSTVATLACLVVASFQAFLFVFVLPVLAGVAFVRREKRLPLVGVVVGIVVWLAVLDLGLGYNYLQGFTLASQQQNPEGFMPVAEPVVYLFTRLEDLTELGLFFTPFLCLLGAWGLRGLWRDVASGGWPLPNTPEREPFVLTVVALACFAGLLVIGVYHTGETARGALYLYPYLCLPVAAAVRRLDPTWRERWVLAGAVVGQTLFLQLLGSYLW